MLKREEGGAPRAAFGVLDLRVILAIARYPGASHTTLAGLIGVSRNTVRARLQRIEAVGAFLCFDRRIDPRSLGYPLKAWAHIDIDQRHMASIATGLEAIPEVVSVHAVSGGGELRADVVARNPEHLLDLTNLLLTIDGVRRARTSISAQELIPHRVQPLIDHVRRALETRQSSSRP